MIEAAKGSINYSCNIQFFEQDIKVMFGNIFCFLFSKTFFFWEYKEKKNSCIFKIKNMFGQLKLKNSFLKKKIENTKICCYQDLNSNANSLNETNLLN